MQKTIALLIIALFTSYSIQSQDSFVEKLNTQRVESEKIVTWSQVSPGNAGYSNFIRFHPTIPQKVALSQDMWNHYQSDNNGSRWYSTVDFDGDGRFGRMLDIEWSYSDAKTALSISTSELWTSQDTGRTFTMVPNCPWYDIDSDGSDKMSWKKKVGAVAIDPINPDTWFVAGGFNIRGMDWMSQMNTATAATPHGKESEYQGKLWRTKNAGKSWQLINKGLNPKAQIGRIVVNPINNKQVFASSNYGIYKSEDGGNSWKQIGQSDLDNNIIMDMDFYYNASNKKFILYLIDQVQYHAKGRSTECSGGIFISSDEGKSWQKMNGNIALDINQLKGGVSNSYYNYIGKWFGITNGEAKKKYPELPKEALQYFNGISTDPSCEGRVYLGFDDPHLKKSIVPGRLWVTEDGEKWINTARLFTDVWKNDAAYWESRNNPWHENMEVGHAHFPIQWGSIYPIRANRGFDVSADGSVIMLNGHNTFLSTDHGNSWNQVDEERTPSGAIVGNGNSNMPGLTIAQDKRNQITLLGSGEHHLWIPTDDSPDERQAIRFIDSAPETVASIAFDPYDANIAYLTSNRQAHKEHIFKSIDGGKSWAIHGVATPATKKWKDDFYTNSLLIDPIDNQYMYHGITKIVDKKKEKEGGFFVSIDGGKTFKQSNVGLPSPARINDLEFDPRDNTNKSLFAAAEYNEHAYHSPLSKGGLYHSSDRGESWKKVNTPEVVKGVHFMHFDNANRLYITTGYRGGGAGVWYTDNFGKSWTQCFKFQGIECIDVSPFDHNLLVVSCRYAAKNPGVYISRDRGQSWAKCNNNIVLPQQIEDIKFDILDATKMWCATLGTGFYKGNIQVGDSIQVVQLDKSAAKLVKGEQVQLRANIVNGKYKGESITYKSANTAIAKVNKKGLVTAVGKGQTKIWASCSKGRFTDYIVLTVMPNDTK